MSENESSMVNWMRTALEELWLGLDSLIAEFSPADWQRPHGPDWLFADFPYHLAYMDRICIARAIELGEALPAAEQVGLSTFNELNDWNQSRFAARPKGQTVEQTLAQMRGSRDYVRRVLANLTDADLAKPAWFPLLNMRGFRPAMINLGFGIGHTWQHMEEARVRHGHVGTMVSPELAHTMLDGNTPVPGIPLYLVVPSTSLFLNASRAYDEDFSFAFNITGPGGGIWIFKPAGQNWHVQEVESADTDLLLSLNLDTYIKLRYFINDMVSLIEAGEITASDDQALAFYRTLFVVPDLNFVFPQMP